jgi:Tol biopolymer transport system component
VAPAAVRLAVPPPPDGSFLHDVESVSVSVSPDGSRIAYTAHSAAEPQRIWIRALTELSARSLAGTDGATSSFWSPDGNSLAFFAGAKLRRIDLRGGAPVTVCDVPAGVGLAGTWGADGQLLFASIEGEAIWRAPASGGVAAAILKPDRALNEARLNWPFFLPDGRRFLFLIRRHDGSGHLMLAAEGKPPREIRPMQSGAQYVAPGYLLFAADGALVGQRFDASRGEVSGNPFSIADKVDYFYSTSYADFAVSPTGTLVVADLDEEQRVTLIDRSGRSLGVIGEPGRYQRMRLSPDGRRLAFDRFKAGAFDLWDVDLASRAETRLTFGQSSEGGAVWSPDGRSLFFSADEGAPPHLLRKDLASGRDESVTPSNGSFEEAADVTPDGKTLVFVRRGAGGNDIWQWGTDGSRPPSAVMTTPFDEESVRLSPDGHALSFSSNVAGRYEVYVSPFPPTGQPSRVSIGGAFFARWSRDGHELLYIASDGRLMAAPVRPGRPPTLGTPVALFQMPRPWLGFEIDPAGRFLAIVPVGRAGVQPLTVVVNWTPGLDR